jgi:LysR family transcriptional activator of nhaA
MIVNEEKTDRLLADLSIQAFDVILTDAPMPSRYKVQAFNHLLGECNVAFLASTKLARKYRKRFPSSLTGAPFLLPTLDTQLRSSLDRWFDQHRIRPFITGEFADLALLKEFGEDGQGIFAVPTVIEDHVRKQHNVIRVGPAEGIRLSFYAISVERTLKHPAVVEILKSARQELFK